MSENFWLLTAVFLVGVLYAVVVAWFRWVSEDGHLPPLSVTAGCSLVVIAFVALRGWEEGLWLLLVLGLLGGPQIVAWWGDWLVRMRGGRRELR